MIALIPIVADGRAGDHHCGLVVAVFDGYGEQFGRVDEAVAELLLARGAPALVGDAGSCQVDDPVHPFEGPRVHGLCYDIPLVGRVFGIEVLCAAQVADLVASFGEHIAHASAEQARPASDQYGLHNMLMGKISDKNTLGNHRWHYAIAR